MRRVRYSVAMSLDGYIAGPSGEFDWIIMDPAIDFAAFFKKVDTMVMGRRTFEVAVANGSAGRMRAIRSIVFSRTLRAEDYPDVTIADDAAGTVASLRMEEGKDIWLMGGGVLFHDLLDAGLVDTVEVGVIPVLLGRGLQLLPPISRTTRLKLTHHDRFPSGVVLLRYDVVRESE